MFLAKGVDIFFARREEYVRATQSGHWEYFRWIEFADRGEIGVVW
jgi:hypothetical protein